MALSRPHYGCEALPTFTVFVRCEACGEESPASGEIGPSVPDDAPFVVNVLCQGACRLERFGMSRTVVRLTAGDIRRLGQNDAGRAG
jgi:hypothetical protein